MTNNEKVEGDSPEFGNVNASSTRRCKWYLDVGGRGADKALVALIRTQAMLLKNNGKRHIESAQNQKKSK